MWQGPCQSLPATRQPSHGAGASRSRHNPCCAHATGLAATLAITLAAGVVLGRQPADPAPPTAGAPLAVAPAADRLSPEAALAAFAVVEAHVREWNPTATPSFDATSLALARGASVELRDPDRARMLGRGRSDARGAPALADALRDALARADERLELPPDALRPARARAIADGVQISLELAGEWRLFEARTPADVDARVAPGLEGVAVRLGARTGMVFPAEMIADGLTPSTALQLAASRAGNAAMGVLDPRTLTTDHGAVFYSFPVTHLVQPRAGLGPFFAHRGGRIVPDSSITAASVRAHAASLAEHLIGRCLERPTGGRLPAVSPGLRPDGAGAWTHTQKALAAAALARFARSKADEGVRVRARYTARALAHDLRRIAAPSPEEAASIAIASGELARTLAVWGMDPTPEGEPGSALFALPQLALDPEALGAGPMGPWIAWGAALGAGDAPSRLDTADRIVRALLNATTDARLAGAMPMLAEAELAITAARRRIDAGRADRSLPSADALRAWRERLWSTRYPGDAPNTDLRGGLVLGGAGSELPTWHALRPLAALPGLLGEPSVTDSSQRVPEIARLLAAARFVRQMTVDESTAWLSQDPPAALGGVRAAVWTIDRPPEATALALLTISGLADTLEPPPADAP